MLRLSLLVLVVAWCVSLTRMLRAVWTPAAMPVPLPGRRRHLPRRAA